LPLPSLPRSEELACGPSSQPSSPLSGVPPSGHPGRSGSPTAPVPASYGVMGSAPRSQTGRLYPANPCRARPPEFRLACRPAPARSLPAPPRGWSVAPCPARPSELIRAPTFVRLLEPAHPFVPTRLQAQGRATLPGSPWARRGKRPSGNIPRERGPGFRRAATAESPGASPHIPALSQVPQPESGILFPVPIPPEVFIPARPVCPPLAARIQVRPGRLCRVLILPSGPIPRLPIALAPIALRVHPEYQALPEVQGLVRPPRRP